MNDATTPRPTTDDRDAWHAYWIAQGEPWRTEPEIASERQRELAERRDTIKPDIAKGIYPFKDIRLSRADVEWLLHVHGPINWTDEAQREREGLDLRGALLNRTPDHPALNLSVLPLARTRFGLSFKEWISASVEQQEQAAARLEGVSLPNAHLEATNLSDAHLERADLPDAHLIGASLNSAHLEGANLNLAHLNGALLLNTHLEGTDLSEIHLEEAGLINAYMEGAGLSKAHLERAVFREAHLEGADLSEAHLEGADFREAHLEGAFLINTHLEGADLRYVHLEGKQLNDADYIRIQRTRHEYAPPIPQVLPPADLRLAFFSEATTLNSISLGDAHQCVLLADIRWGGVNLAVIAWVQQNITRIGDETEARRKTYGDGGKKDYETRIEEWESTVRAYRQLSVALRAQGMNEIADRFAYRGQLCRRRLTRFGGLRSFPAYLGSLLLDFISGYGYRPARSLVTYAFVISIFAVIYGLLGQNSHPLTPQEAVVVSMTAFHGRGFFATSFSPGDPQAIAAAIEAFVGLFIEVTFIATFTQRFFSR
jgi:uncharacterized protein YjbI with pentapeptide repeats